MTCTSIGASMTHAFNPAVWLTEFETVGGAYTLTDTLNLFITVPGRSDDELIAARHMIRDLTEHQRTRIIALLCQREIEREG